MAAVTSLKICTLIDSFYQKHIKFYMKKYRKIMSHDTEGWFKEKPHPAYDIVATSQLGLN